ncbi:5-formyltetrahydrofolate cyclo-ligase [Ilumatobacter fluminis]|uniref:5-formyltetrahydrofolate cyclo-ligase n=1 Tax=Ilumatobacter fluminis TaxID=467091 RepID=UPI001AAE2655|nr:5-formyltetrahydrofolate cyclo-ligase [Ilumatobacter fluminis]
MSEQIGERKRERRADLSAVRAGLDPDGGRAVRLWSHVRNEASVRAARVVMAFDSVPGEPTTDAFVAWCRSLGKTVVVPAADPDAIEPVDPSVPDVVVVPGLGFTADGARLGRGGGWYDRFLARRRADCVAIGVCFAEQLVDELPVEDHDVAVDVVVTDDGVVAR